MAAEQFVKLFKGKMLEEELVELGNNKGQFDTVYFPGLISSRTTQDLYSIQKENAEKTKAFIENAQLIEDSNGEYQGNPIFDNIEGYYNVNEGQHLGYRYEIIKVLGKGSFAQVVQCIDHKSANKSQFAIKITRNTQMDRNLAYKEALYLNYIMNEDPYDNHNIVRMEDQIYFRQHHCFVFELLHIDLFEHLKSTGFVGFSTEKIMNYALQIVQALVFLEKHNIIHCDLKPENILCADKECNILKIVDFGSGCFRDEQIYTYVQSRFYRSPEVILRIRYSEKVDIWSLGCILAELYTGEPLFQGNNEQEQLELIMELCGMPPESMIDKSRKKEHYFDTDYSPYLIEDEKLGILRIPNSRALQEQIKSDDIMFIDFIQKCIEIDPEVRFSASEAINHPWLKQALSQQKTQYIDQNLKSKQVKTSLMENKYVPNNILILYQPQIIRENREREGDGVKQTPQEFSPERDIIVQRKKPQSKPNKESFGIKLNNLNMIQDKKQQKKNELFIKDVYKNQNSQNVSQNPQQSDSSRKKRKKNSLINKNSENSQIHVNAIYINPKLVSVKDNKQELQETAEYSTTEEVNQINNQYINTSQQPTQKTQLKNQYYSIYKQHKGTGQQLLEKSSNFKSKQNKSIIPEIDFKNKYIVLNSSKKQQSQINYDKQFKNSHLMDELLINNYSNNI